ncbi:hypothetical protein RHGRI_033564 [Rhododendron griersonianum]|uniref:RRM domain-containing protein n=1 Tax=Rhododendron griersonianum TaxID=479676 RepID=A0AAV6I128_9ERIC|nr:hypothetical protein RHGRI_033564 [Rhododendron griersonianum]
MERERESVCVSEREGTRERGGAEGRNGGQEGGWIPVIRSRRVQSRNWSGSKETFTLFVDNIPESKDHSWLHRSFNKFGVVRDAFIPQKRSKRTGNKFGFVRFECRVAADLAISRMNGVWVENLKLFVKEACFGLKAEHLRSKPPRIPSEPVRGISLKQGTNPSPSSSKQPLVERERGETYSRSFAQVLKGESSKLGIVPKTTIHVKPVAMAGYSGVPWQ